MPLDDLLQRNREWAQARRARDPEFFARLARGQQPRLLWIGCSDSRVPPEEILGCGPGDLFVHRNIANIVAYHDGNLASVVQYATAHLGIGDIVVCGHYGCGGIQAACAETPPEGTLGDWLGAARSAKLAVDQRLEREGLAAAGDEYQRLVVEENVRLQLKSLERLHIVWRRRAESPGSLRLHGWVYDIGTGLVKVAQSGDT